MRLWTSKTKCACAGVAILLAIGLVVGTLSLVPSYAEVRNHFQPSDAYVYDRADRLIQVVRRRKSKRQFMWLNLNQIPQQFRDQLIRAEDRNFYLHPGIDPFAAARAAKNRLAGGPQSGASTLTMQLANLLDPRLQKLKRRHPWRAKIWQIVDAIILELRWSKDEILTAYINMVPFRGELEGLNAAAQLVFGKQPLGLNQSEVGLLVAMIRSPNAAPAQISERACALLRLSDCASMKALMVNALNRGNYPGDLANFAPHAARRILKNLPAETRDVKSTLDLVLQKYIYQVIKDQIHNVIDRNAHDAAVIVVENATGEILAYVGSSESLSAAPFIDGAVALRQAGSTLKPFIYGLAFEKHLLTPASILDDSPTELAVTAGGVYRPQNYDQAFRGAISVREALAGSLNIPAVRTLLMTGVDAAVQLLTDFGFSSMREAEYYGPSLALGSADVSLWELAGAYRALATGGIYSTISFLPGNSDEKRVLSPQSSFLIRSILSDNRARAPSFGLQNNLQTTTEAAVKTGTSKDMRDNWCIGFSQQYTVAVWVGNFSGAPMWNLSGVSGAAPIWADIMHYLHRDKRVKFPLPPPGIVEKNIRFSFKDRLQREWFASGTEPLDSLIRDVGRSYEYRITYPADGSTFATDHDIPDKNQKMLFKATSTSANLRWVLNGTALGNATQDYSWGLQRGKFKLALQDSRTGTVLDEVAFQVK